MVKNKEMPVTQEDIHKFIEDHQKNCKDCQEQEASRQFKERMLLIEKDEELSERKHQRSMKEMEYRRESDRLHHERELERGRIFRAEERKTVMLKAQEFRNRERRPKNPNAKYPESNYPQQH